MIARPKLAPEQQMTIEEFLAFTDTRPEEERWELIEGVPVLNPSPIDYHQIVVTNIVAFLVRAKIETNAPWLPLIGTGTRVPASIHNLPQPDVMVKEHAPTGSAVSEDGLAIFEVLSKSNTRADQAWRRRIYASVQNCQHYVTVSLKAVEIVAYERSTDWQARALTQLDRALELPALGVAIPLADIYRWTPLGGEGAPGPQ
ncbi:MAG: Uma2 family endonuclease [Hyphomicrobiaceae bacterium]|jgi:Uma2 family endonuclease